MYILTNKDNVITEISNIYERDEEYRNIKVDNHNIAYAPDEQINVYEILEIPEGVIAAKYCYTEEQGFYKNENYREPEPNDIERINILENEVTNLQKALLEVLKGGNIE